MSIFDRCGTCIHYTSKKYKSGKLMKSGKCNIRGVEIFHYAKQTACKHYKFNQHYCDGCKYFKEHEDTLSCLVCKLDDDVCKENKQ